MYFVLYDRNFKSIGETYILESWNRIQRATDFDNINIVGEETPYSAEPFFIIINNKQGKQLFSGLASTPTINEKTKKTSLSLKDYMTLLNSEIVINWNLFSGTTVSSYIEFVFSNWLGQIDVGLKNIVCDVSSILEEPLDTEIYSFSGLQNVLAYTLVSDAILYYDLYCEPILDLRKKSLTFVFKKAYINPLSIRLSDFGINTVEKSFGDYNRATVYNHNFEKAQEWALTQNNNIVKLPSMDNLVYPTKNKNFIAEQPNNNLTEEQALFNATYDAVIGLSENRYQENIDLNVQQYKSIIDLTKVDFSYKINIYTKEGEYKTLPVGEIETDSKGKHIVRLGHRIQELTQEI